MNKNPTDTKDCPCSEAATIWDWPNKFRDKYKSTGKFNRVTHCIFDVDGTLLDSEDNYQRLVQTVVERYGKQYTKELEAELYGGTDRDICTRIVEKLNLPVSVDEVEDELFELSHQFLPQCPAKEGVVGLLNHLHKHKIPFAIASNSTAKAIRLFGQAKPHIFSLFHHKVTATDPELKQGKPAPDIYLLAASRFPDKPKPRNCLAFEDSLTGVKAAIAADMQVVMITSMKLTNEDAQLPTILLRTLLDFKPELFGLPPFNEVCLTLPACAAAAAQAQAAPEPRCLTHWDVRTKFLDRPKSKKKKFRKVTHCIFDVDGTLLDSEDAYQNLVRSVVEKHGKEWTAELAKELYGGTDRDICTRIVNNLNLPVSVDDVENELFDEGDKCLPRSPVMHGVVRLVKHLHKNKIPFAIASNSTSRTIDLYAKAKPYLFDLFHHRVCANDPELQQGKPAPDIYLLAASRFPEEPKPESCLAFEDSITGVKAALAANMQVVMITTKPVPKDEAKLPTILIPTFKEFKPELFGLPPFDESESDED